MHPYIALFGRNVPAFGLCAASGIVIALFLSLARAYRRHLRIDAAVIIFTFALAFGFAGAIVTYLFVTYAPADLWDMLRRGTLFSEASPGYVFYGGLIFGLPGALLGARLAGTRLAPYVPALLPSLPLAHAFGRVGCFLGGCCYGCETRLPFGVVFPAGGSVPRLPVQLMEAALLLTIALFLCMYTRNRARGALTAYILLYAPARFVLEFFRGDEIRGAFLALSTSQWVSLILLVFVGVRALYLYRKYR